MQALAIEAGTITALGSNEEILDLARPGCRTFNLHGKTVWPGLHDAHLHLQQLSLALSMVDCETESKAECLRRVRERAERTSPGEWILGHGWNQNEWEGGFGNAADLDEISRKHPIYLTAKSLHAGWANTRALQECGLNRETSNPPKGVLQRDPRGELTGILLEDAMRLVGERIPLPKPEKLAGLMQNTQASLWRMGLTSVHDFDPLTSFKALQIVEREGKLRLRVTKSLPLEALPRAVMLGVQSGFGGDWLRFGSVKMFSDGALGPHTAAILSGYDDEPGNTGMLMLTREEILDHGKLAAGSGLSLAIHAIGDRANREVLDGLRALRRYESENGLPHLRHRIEHVQLIDPEDQPSLTELDIIASMQPIHAPSDRDTADTCWGERAGNAYAWRSLCRVGAHLAFGSDAPVESPNPFLGLHAAVNRSLYGSGRPTWHAEQALTLKEALLGFTCGAAYASGMETRLGRLTSGHLADLIVLEEDPFTLPARELGGIRPIATMVGGEWVWQDQERAGW